jgi:hypothetical protein
VLPDALFEAQAQQAPPSGSRGSSRRPWGVGPPHAAATHRSSSCGTTMHK